MPVRFEDQPATLEEAVNLIIRNLNDDERNYIKKNGTVGLHHGTGTNMRNGWNLWGAQPDTPTTLRDHFKTVYGLGHADDMSGMIMEALEGVLNNGSFTLEEAKKKAAYYHDYWHNMGVDPLTQEKF